MKKSNQGDRTQVAVCDGGGGALGHPLVYLPFNSRESVTCYYCGRRFIRGSDKTV